MLLALAFLLATPQAHDDLYWPTVGLFVATVALVIVGAIAAWIAVCTLRDLRHQTDNTRKIADAALQNATALVSAERAWIMVGIERVPAVCGPVITGESTLRGSHSLHTHARFRLKYVNEGRTIAWIDEILACVRIVKELPLQPEFGALEMVRNEPEGLGSKGAGQFDLTLHADGQERDGEMSVIWGVLKYRDAFGSHTTVFGYRITVDYQFERLAGSVYRAYNTTA